MENTKSIDTHEVGTKTVRISGTANNEQFKELPQEIGHIFMLKVANYEFQTGALTVELVPHRGNHRVFDENNQKGE